MIAPFRFLWKQFQGSQIGAITQAIFEYLKASFDPLFDYFNTLAISSANSEHLTTIGALQGIARPLLQLTPYSMFWFSNVPQEGTYYPSTPYATSDHGLSDFADMNYGGHFSDIEDAEKQYGYLSTPIFRAVLQGIRDSKGEAGSLAQLDDILYSIFKLLNPTQEPDYTIHAISDEEARTTTRSPGDIQVNLGTEELWGSSLTEVVAEVRLLGNTVYFPIPTLFCTAEI